MAVVVVRYETTATARWALLFIIRAFFNDTITVAVWTGFHVCTLWGCYHTPDIDICWRFADPEMAEAFGKGSPHEFVTFWKNGRRVLAACPWPV
jgi:hypothetical protein